jgi:hypothetical protein
MKLMTGHVVEAEQWEAAVWNDGGQMIASLEENADGEFLTLNLRCATVTREEARAIETMLASYRTGASS